MADEMENAFQGERSNPLHLQEVQALLKDIDGQLRIKPGHRLFTVLLIDVAAGLNRRIYSSHPLEYPLGGTKALVRDSEFFQRIVLKGEPRICVNREECKKAFFDHERIFSLGCGSAINMPVVWNGVTVGALNLLDAGGRYSIANTEDVKASAAMAVPALLHYLNKEPM